MAACCLQTLHVGLSLNTGQVSASLMDWHCLTEASAAILTLFWFRFMSWNWQDIFWFLSLNKAHIVILIRKENTLCHSNYRYRLLIPQMYKRIKWWTVGPKVLLCVKQLRPRSPCVGQYKEGCWCRHQHCALSVTGENGQHCSTVNVSAHVLKQPTCVNKWEDVNQVWTLCGGPVCILNISNVSKQWFIHYHAHLFHW